LAQIGLIDLFGLNRQRHPQLAGCRPVRIIVPYPAGGGTDIIARLMGQWLSERLGHQFIIENRPGGNSNIATEVVVRAPPAPLSWYVACHQCDAL
jgi:tripartite-type tricarboxylate transporter receptor subunit TctC